MKKRILIFLIILCYKHVSANDYKPFFAQFISNETNSITGTLYIKAFIKCTDTLNYIEDITYLLPNGWSQINYQSYLSGTSTTLYMPGDSIPVEFTLSYPTSSLPYYPVELKIFAKIRTKYNDTLIARFHGRVFFTPWNTIETWAEEDFYSSGRVWKEEVLHGSQSRISIDKDSIPISDIGTNDTITEDWQYEARLVTYPGLPFYVKMKPIHPDTMKYYAENFGDSISSLSNKLNKVGNFRYIGNITGTLSTTLVNDNNDSNPLLLKGVLIKLIDRDGPGGYISDVLDETHTDENGNFTLSYNVWQPFENGELELELHVKAKNKNYKYEVLSKGGFKILFGITEELAPFDLGSAGHDYHRNNIQLITNDNAFKVCNWVYNTFHYCENQGILSKVIPNDKKLHIATNCGNSMMIPNNIKLLDMFTGGDEFFNPTIFLDEEDDEHENTLYHEWGHYMMWRMQGMNFIMRLDKSQCLKNFGTHSWDEEQHIRMVWTEGFAYAIAFILDGANWAEDDEYGFNENRFTLESRIQWPNINNGFKGEYYMACAIYDLWDGPDKGLPTANNPIPGTVNHPFNDRLLAGGNVGNDWILEEDNISLSFNGLMRPIYENDGLGNGLKNIYEYVMYLMNVIYDNDCTVKSDIARCFRENRVMMDINFYEDINSTNGGNILDRNTGFSSDNLYELKSFEDRGVNIVCIPSTDELFIKQEIIEEIPNHICQLITNSNNSVEVLTDDLRLGYNFTGINEISECRINTNSSFNMTAILCNGVQYSINNTHFQIGNINGQNETKFNVENGAIFRLDPMSILRINNNSKLTIEEGATLHIFPNSRIILNGDNAILEIKGTLNVHDNATFTFEGGTAGSGHVVFNTSHKNNIILGNNSRIRFVGANNNDRVMEVPAGAVFWTDNIQPAGNVQSTFEITDGFVALGNNALINLGTAVNLNRVRFYAEQASPARSICLWGQKHKIDNVIVENVSEGIHSFNTYGGNQLILKNVSVAGAQRALFSEGKGATLVNFESINNTTGIEIKASTGSNIFHYPKVHGALNYATRFTGNSSSKLVINKADYFDNINGVSFTGGGTLVLNCGRIHNILPSSANGNGINIKSGTLILADALGFKAGRVSFLNNKNTIVLSNTKHYLNSGYNDLSYKVGTGNLALSGSSSHFVPLGGIIRADNNLWDGINVPTTLCSSPPGGYQNYNLICKLKIGSMLINQCVNIPTSPIINLTQFTTEQNNRCVIGSGTGNDNGTIATSKVISTTHFNEVNLQLAVGTILYNMYNVENPDYPYMINLWAELLTEVSYTSPYNEEDFYYINLIENKMMEALGTFISNDTTLLQSQPGLPHFETVTDVQNEWIEAVDDDTSSLAIELKNLFNFDKGITYHLQGETEEAQMQWSAMQNWANIEYLEHTDYWLCQLQREIAIKYCGKNPDSINQFPQCQYYEEGNNAIYGPINTNEKNNKPQADHNIKENKISKQLILYPNPAKTTVTAVLETSQKDFATINIYTIDGKCLKTIKQIKLSLGLNKINISLADVPVGYYTISIQSRNINWNEKIIIE